MPDRSRIFGKREKFISMSSKVLKRRKKSTLLLFGNGTLFIVVLLMLLPGMLFGAYHLFNYDTVDSRFVVKKIQVGPEGSVPERVEKAVRKAVKARGENIFKVNIYEMKKRIEKIPEVESVRIHRILPDTLKIEVSVRKARAVLDTRPIICVDSEGVLLPGDASRGRGYLTQVCGIELGSEKPGETSNNRDLFTALEILELCDSSRLNEQVTVEELHVKKNGEISLFVCSRKPMRHIFTVILGDRDFPQRLAYLIEILDRESSARERVHRVINLTYNRPLSRSAGASHGP